MPSVLFAECHLCWVSLCWESWRPICWINAQGAKVRTISVCDFLRWNLSKLACLSATAIFTQVCRKVQEQNIRLGWIIEIGLEHAYFFPLIWTWKKPGYGPSTKDCSLKCDLLISNYEYFCQNLVFCKKNTPNLIKNCFFVMCQNQEWGPQTASIIISNEETFLWVFAL